APRPHRYLPVVLFQPALLRPELHHGPGRSRALLPRASTPGGALALGAAAGSHTGSALRGAGREPGEMDAQDPRIHRTRVGRALHGVSHGLSARADGELLAGAT